MANEFDVDYYKIASIVHPSHEGVEVSEIDFTLHLSTSTALDKRIQRDLSFRPLYAYYYDQGTDYARRRFDFLFDPSSGLMTDRKEWLAYYLLDGTLGAEFLIKHRSYNLLDAEDFQQSTNESISLRKDIVGHIKTTISGVVQVLNPGYSVVDIIAETDPFFQELTSERLAFIDIGSKAYRDALLGIDLDTTPYTYLSFEVSPGITLRDYIVGLT